MAVTEPAALPLGGPEPFGFSYPLLDPISPDVKGLLRDFYLWHHAVDAPYPFTIDWMRGFSPGGVSGSSAAGPGSAGLPDPTHAVDLRVRDANGRTVFDSTTAGKFSFRHWGSNYLLYEWNSETAVCRALQYIGPEALTVPIEFRPVRAVLDPRTTVQRAERLDTLKAVGQSFAGDVEFEAGYNWKFALTAPTGSNLTHRRRNRVVVSARPGDGDGRVPDCSQDPVLRRINGVGPDARGNFNLTGAECYRVTRPTVSGVPLPSTLDWRNDCQAPCRPEDYHNVYQAMRNVHDTYLTIGRRAERTRDRLLAVRARWIAQQECRTRNPYRAVMISVGGSCIDGVAGFNNSTQKCVRAVDVTMTFQHSSGQIGELDTNTVWLYDSDNAQPKPYSLGGVWPTYRVFWDSIDPGRSGRVRFRFCFPPDGDQSVTITMSGTVNGQPLDANPLEVSAALRP